MHPLRGKAGCVSDSGVGGRCSSTGALAGATAVAVSRDGRFVYAVANFSSSISAFGRDARTGRITPVRGRAGCVADPLVGAPCTDGAGLTKAAALAFGPGDRTVYVASAIAVAAFGRNAKTGVLKQIGCVGEAYQQPTPEGCSEGKLLTDATAVAVTPDGRNVYTGNEKGVGLFRRSASGSLAQLPDPSGCIADVDSDEVAAGVCTPNDHVGNVDGLAVSADGRFVYAAAAGANTVDVFARNAATGALNQLPGGAGCVEDSKALQDELTPVCSAATSLGSPSALALSPDGRFLYVTADGSDSIDVFSRDTRTGALRQLPGKSACVSADGPPCAPARVLGQPSALALSSDGRNLYAASFGDDAVAVFSRSPQAGPLAQLPGAAGCVGGNGCTPASALDNASGVAVSGDGRNVYATSIRDGAVSTFSRTAAIKARKQ